MTNQHINVYRAVFQAEGQPDTEVRVLPLPEGGYSFSINFGDSNTVTSPAIPDTDTLQLVESLQFIVDTISTQVPGRLSPFVRSWSNVATDTHAYARKQGFWDGEEDRTYKLLMWSSSELGEAFSAIQRGEKPYSGIPEFLEVEIEIADAVIILMDLAHKNGWRIAQAIEAKMKFNETRPYKHGKENA